MTKNGIGYKVFTLFYKGLRDSTMGPRSQNHWRKIPSLHQQFSRISNKPLNCCRPLSVGTGELLADARSPSHARCPVDS